MKYIDLHVHSNMSDGTLSPAEVVKHAANKGLAAIALTDHDTIDGVDEALRTSQELKEQGIVIRVIPGTELSVGYKKRDIHILGLFVDHHSIAFQEALHAACRERDNRNEKMCENLRNAGIPITVEDMKKDNKNTIITRAHFAKFMVEQQITKTREEAFQRYLDADGPYYVPRQYITPEDAIALILKANGVPVLAHPLLYNLPPAELDTLIERLKTAGLKGIEAIYSANISNDEAYVRSLARKYGLSISGGSDFHGANKPAIEIGIGRGNLQIPESILEDLK